MVSCMVSSKFCLVSGSSSARPWASSSWPRVMLFSRSRRSPQSPKCLFLRCFKLPKMTKVEAVWVILIISSFFALVNLVQHADFETISTSTSICMHSCDALPTWGYSSLCWHKSVPPYSSPEASWTIFHCTKQYRYHLFLRYLVASGTLDYTDSYGEARCDIGPS